MIKLSFLLCLLLTTSFEALAGWSLLAADGVAAEYVNIDTISRNDNVVKMWNMSNFKEQQAVGNGRLFQSTKVQQEYDCFANTKRILTLIHYTDPMGVGQVAFLDNTPGEWRKVKPSSLGQVHLKAACLTDLSNS